MRRLPPIDVLRERLEVDESCRFGLRWVSGRRAGKPAGSPRAFGYGNVQLVCAGRITNMRAHRVVYALAFDRDPFPLQVDHIDRDTGNNRPGNLRLCTQAQNSCNTASRSGSSSRFLGVSRHRSKWRAELKSHGRRAFIAHFSSEEAAARAYDAAALRLHGDFASLNFPGPTTPQETPA